MCLWTGQRRRNVQLMHWEHVDLKQAVWYLPDTKNGTSHFVPLIPQALAILERRSQRKKSDTWVFPSNCKPDTPLCRVDKAWGILVKKAGLENLRLHDLRRSLASWMAITGASVPQLAQMPNHHTMGNVQVYSRLNVGSVRGAMTKAAEVMTKAVRGEPLPVEYTGIPAVDLRALEKEFDACRGEEYFSEHEAAQVLGLSLQTLRLYRSRNLGPPYLRRNFGNIVYPRQILLSWAHERKDSALTASSAR